MFCFFFSSRRRHTRCALVTGVRRVLFRSPLSRRLLRANSGAMAAAIAPQGDLKGVEGMEQDNRESWLNRVAAGMAPLFAALDAPLPARIRVAIGFNSSGRKGKAIGECWDNRLSADGHFEIFIRPDLAHAPDDMPAQIEAILAHALVHAAVGIDRKSVVYGKRVSVRVDLGGRRIHMKTEHKA